eukprot:scaffold5478_cov161-Amphora_coffeaeformis.AAC.14
MEHRSEANQFIDLEYKREQQKATEWVGDGQSANRSWMFLSRETAHEVVFAVDRPFVLYIRARLTPSHKSYAYEQHPFVTFVHFLKAAEKKSVVFISISFLTDFMVIDELCHYADATILDLNVNIILRPKTWVIESFKLFVGKDSRCEEAVACLHIKRYNQDEADSHLKYSHSKVMVTTGGTMIRS